MGGNSVVTLGKLADFVTLSADPTAVPVDEIKDIVVDTTVVGKVVYDGNSGSEHE